MDVFGDREDEAEEGECEAEEGDEDGDAAFAVLRVGDEGLRGEPAADEAAEVRPVVDAAHEEAHDKEQNGPLPYLPGHKGGDVGFLVATVHDERGKKSENRAGRAHCGIAGNEVGEDKTDRPCDRVDDKIARGAKEMPHIRAELPNPHHIEQDVEEATVQVSRGQYAPPRRVAICHAEHDQGALARAEHAEKPTGHRQRGFEIEQQADGVQGNASGGDQGEDVDATAEQPVQRGAESPKIGLIRAAMRAAFLVGVDEIAATRADHGGARRHGITRVVTS